MIVDAHEFLRLNRLQRKAESHLKVGLKIGNRSLIRHAAKSVKFLDAKTTAIAFSNVKPYSDFD
jgi:hypothetical protein